MKAHKLLLQAEEKKSISMNNTDPVFTWYNIVIPDFAVPHTPTEPTPVQTKKGWGGRNSEYECDACCLLLREIQKVGDEREASRKQQRRTNLNEKNTTLPRKR